MSDRARALRPWLIAVVAVPLIGLAVLAHRRFTAMPPRDASASSTEDSAARESLMADWAAYGAKVDKIDALLKAAPTSQPSVTDSEELLDQAQHDPDYRVRVRAMAVLPYLRDRDRAIAVLTACLRDRDRNATGDGNVPLYATRYLADMKAAGAVPDVEDWINYVRSQACPYPVQMKAIMLKNGMARLSALKSASTQRTSNPT